MARINSRQVEAFRAMMLTGSVTEAAKLMAVTQPAVSRLLRDFQALLKMELFEKRGTGLVPMARVPGSHYHLIAPVLDAGMMGIMVPMVETAEQAADLARCMAAPRPVR